MSWTRRWPLVVATVVVLIGTLGSNHDAAGSSVVVAGLCAVVAVAGIVLTLSRPRVGVVVAGAAAFAYFALGLQPGPIFLAIPVAGGVAALRSRPRTLVPALVGALTLLTIGLFLSRHRDDVLQLWPVVGSAAMTAAATTLSWWLTSRREVAEELGRRAESEERLRMAQDLHDGVGHGLAVIAMQAGVSLHVLDKDPAKARAGLQAIRDISREALDALRSELASLATTEPAPRRPARGVYDLPALAERVRSGGLQVDLVGNPGPVPTAVGEAVHAVVQESLTNVLRHADAARVEIEVVREGPDVVLAITDDGCGSDDRHDDGMGISGMCLRVERLGGTFVAGPTPTGWRVRATLPAGTP